MESSRSGGEREGSGSRSKAVSSSRAATSPSSWCHTAAPRTKDHTHRWTIEDFEAKTRTMKVGDKVCSNEFTVGGQQIILKVYPNGTVGNKNNVSIFLENRSDESLSIAEILFTFQAPHASPLSWNAPRKELEPDDDWGFQRFVSVAKLKEKKLIADDGTLEIVTKITREQPGKNVHFQAAEEMEVSEVWFILLLGGPLY